MSELQLRWVDPKGVDGCLMAHTVGSWPPGERFQVFVTQADASKEYVTLQLHDTWAGSAYVGLYRSDIAYVCDVLGLGKDTCTLVAKRVWLDRLTPEQCRHVPRDVYVVGDVYWCRKCGAIAPGQHTLMSTGIPPGPERFVMPITQAEEDNGEL